MTARKARDAQQKPNRIVFWLRTASSTPWWGGGALAARFLITAAWPLRAAMTIGAVVLLYMAVTGRALDWWEK